MAYTAAIIGTGTDSTEPGESFGMGYKHADAYRAHDAVEVVACADRHGDRVAAFADRYDIDADAIYENHRDLLDAVEPDILSVTVQPASHEEIVLDAVKRGVDAIHCEKPMALTYGGARRMAEEAQRNGVQLTFNHQRRFGRPFRQAKRLLDGGEIGTLERVEFATNNLYSNGSHWFDLCNYYNDETAGKWVLAGLDYRDRNVRYGVHNENQAIVQWAYENDVDGLAATGDARSLVGCHVRLIGTAGAVEVGPRTGSDAVLRIRPDGGGWEAVETGNEGIHDPLDEYVRRAIADAVESLRSGTPCELRAENALIATELIFGAWESVRRGGRIDFPLSIDDNPLESMVADGRLAPTPTDSE